MKVISWFIYGAVSLTALSAVAQTATHPESHSLSPSAALSAAVEAAWSRAVQAKEAEGQRRRAEAEQLVANSLWPAQPSVELSHDNGRWRTGQGTRETEVGINLPLWRPGQRSTLRAAAQSEVKFSQAFEQAAKLRVAGEVREAAWAVAAAQAELSAADAQLKTLQNLAEDVERRVKAGDSARVDALAARGEWLAARTACSEIQLRRDAARSRWLVLTGLPAPDAFIEPAPPPTVTEIRHPELELARLNTERAEKRIDSVRLLGRESPEVSVRYRHEAAGDQPDDAHSIGLGLRLPFGAPTHNRPLEAASLTELDVARTQEARLREMLAAERDTAQARVRAAEEQLRLDEERAALLRERASLLQRSYQAGNTSLPDLLRVLDSAAQAENSLIRQRVALGLARSRLLQTLGMLP